MWKPWNVMTRVHGFVYRRSGGRIGGKMAGAPILLLDHVGRRSGRHRTNPLIYLRDGEQFVIVASKGGIDEHPAWYLNLMANPDTAIEVDGQKIRVLARKADAAEKDRLWPRLVEVYGSYAGYQARTDRDIPVVILAPA